VSKCDVAVIGDWGEAGWGQQVVGDLVRGWKVDAVVTTGDNNYGGREAFDQNCKQQYGDFMALGKFSPLCGQPRRGQRRGLTTVPRRVRP
jgi:hypothetical protein